MDTTNVEALEPLGAPDQPWLAGVNAKGHHLATRVMSSTSASRPLYPVQEQCLQPTGL